MPTIPDDHQPHHDPGQPAAGKITLAGLREKYGSDWTILIHLDSAIVSAEHRSGDGRAVRYLVAHSVAELAARLELPGPLSHDHDPVNPPPADAPAILPSPERLAGRLRARWLRPAAALLSR